MRFDSPDVLRKVLDHPNLFPAAKQIDEFVRKLLSGKLKTVVAVDELRRVCQALGTDMFHMVAEGLSDTEAKSIVGKVDPKNKEAKTAGGPAQRVLLVELGTGQVDPRAVDIKKAVTKEPSRKSGAGKAMQSEATSATRKIPGTRTSAPKRKS